MLYRAYVTCSLIVCSICFIGFVVGCVFSFEYSDGLDLNVYLLCVYVCVVLFVMMCVLSMVMCSFCDVSSVVVFRLLRLVLMMMMFVLCVCVIVVCCVGCVCVCVGVGCVDSVVCVVIVLC